MFVIILSVLNQKQYYTKSAIVSENNSIRWSPDFKFAKFFDTLEEARTIVNELIKTKIYPFNVIVSDCYYSAGVTIVPITFGEVLSFTNAYIETSFVQKKE